MSIGEPIYISGCDGEITIRWPNVLLTIDKGVAAYAILKGTTWHPGQFNCETDARHAADEIGCALRDSVCSDTVATPTDCSGSKADV